jgi:sporulation protein YlmC with PRC-barrel domain
MHRLVIMTVAASSLAATAALAQSPPAATQESGGTAASTHSMSAIAEQKPDQWLASKLRGMDVMGPDDKKIGSVSDLLINRDGKIAGLVVGVGGFLGIGAKDVALPFDAFKVVAGSNGQADQLRVATTKDQLDAAPTFKPYEPPRPAAPAGGGMRAPTSPMSPPSRP